MRTDLPTSIAETQHDLTPPGLAYLYRLQFKNGTIILLSPNREVTWQGEQYDELPCHLADIGQDADGQVTRPKFTFANPGGLFSAELAQRTIEGATLTRYRLAVTDLEADRNFALTETFRVSRIVNVSQARQSATVELRDVLDGHQFKVPARAYYPPEFPHVRLS